MLKYELITAAVQATLDAVGDIVRADDIQSALIVRDPAKTHPSVGQLLEVLRAEPSLAIFNGRMQVVANHAMRWEIGDLAMWLMRRGLQVGPAQAVADLQRYLDEPQIPFTMVLGITGLNLEGPCDFGGGIALLPWERLPDSYQKHTIYTKFLTSFGLKWPSAAVMREISLPKLHVSGEYHQLMQLDESELWDALLCIGVVGPFAPEVLVSWLEPPVWAPVRAGAFSLPYLEGRPRHDVWTKKNKRGLIYFSLNGG